MSESNSNLKKEKIEPVPTESPDIFNYLRQEIPVEDLKEVSSPQRLDSIDVVKGLAILFILLAHFSQIWLNQNWIFLHYVVWTFLDVFGPAIFFFLSALSVIFSIRRKEGKLPPKVIRNRIFSRGAAIMAVGLLFNFFFWSNEPFPLNFWGWNVLFFIGFSQIISYMILKLKRSSRAIIGVFLIIFGPSIREAFYLYRSDNIVFGVVNYLINSPVRMVPFLPWISICFISTIFGEILYKAMIDGSEQALYALYRIFLFWGIIFLGLGIGLGFPLHTSPTEVVPNIFPWVNTYLDPSQYPWIDYLRLANQSVQNLFPWAEYPGMPDFLIRSTMSNNLYNIGWSLLFVAISLKIVDINKRDNLFIKMLIFYGKISLSLFIILWLFMALFNILPVWYFAFHYFAGAAILGFAMYIWMKYFKGVGSPEWIMVQISRIAQKTEEEVSKVEEKVRDRIKKVEYKTPKKEKSK
jgi:uncharacterized membrane protein